MIPNRPLFYLAIPSIAAVLGLVWYRRKQSVHCDTGGGDNKKDKNKIKNKSDISENKNGLNAANNSSSSKIELNNQQSDSLPITNSSAISSVNNKDSGCSDKFGKSAPIDIVPNQRSPPMQINDPKLLDAELLKLKIQESDLKNLQSIEEQDDFSVSPSELPGSTEIRKFHRFSTTASKKIDPPVVIKANMNAAKISPKGSFAPDSKFSGDKNLDAGKQHEKDEGRESANHSPIDEFEANNDKHTDVANKETDNKQEDDDLSLTARQPPIASPPLSLCSIQSNDSGKGSSPPHSVGAPASTYEFIISFNLVGHLIGRKGSYVNRIKDKTGANVVVRRHPESGKFKVCSIEGTQQEIDGALKMIRERLPEKQYPNLTLQRVYFASQHSIVPLPAIETNCLHVSVQFN
jgi:A-kinase anchor protein 1, mitochondrial